MEEKNSAINDDTLERLAGLARLVNTFKENDKRTAEKTKIRDDFDRRFDTPAINTIKAAIPYIDRRYRRGLGVMVKLIEIDKFLSEYRGVEIMSSTGEDSSMEMLRAVVPNLPEENRSVGEMLIRLLEIRDIARSLEQGGGGI